MSGTDAHQPTAPARMAWSELPAELRHRIEERLGSAVVDAQTQAGGFSPGVAARVRLRDDRRVFVKAAGPVPNPRTPELHREEARITAALPPDAGVPALIACVEFDGWVALVLEDIEGRSPAQPWRRAELERVLSAVSRMSGVLDPAPVDVPTVAARFGPEFRGWRELRDADPDLVAAAGLDDRARGAVDALAGREPRWEDAAAGTALLHLDLRADNLLLTRNRVVVVDWPWAARGARWFDVVALGPSVIADGPPEAMDLLDRHLAAQGADVDRVTTVLVAFTGYLLWQSVQAPPPGLPTVRELQRRQGEAALRWMCRRLAWDTQG